MRLPARRSCESFSSTFPVGSLPENPRFSFTIGLKGHAAAIGRPDRSNVRPIERQPAQWAALREVVQPNRTSVIGCLDGQLLSIGRKASRMIGPRRNIERVDLTVTRHERKHTCRELAGSLARDVHKHSIIGKIKM